MVVRASFKILGPASVRSLIFSRNYLIAATVPGTIKILDTSHSHVSSNEDAHTKTLEVGKMWSVACYEDLLVTGGDDGVVRLWSVETASPIKEFRGHINSAIHVVCIPNDQQLISAGTRYDPTIRIWEISSGQCQKVLRGHTWGIISLIINGEQLVSASGDGTIRIWDMDTGACAHILQGHARYAYSLGFNEDRTVLGAACGHGDIMLWRIQDGTLMATCKFHQRAPTQLANHNGHLVSSSADGSICTWNWTDGSLICAEKSTHQGAVRGMAWTSRYMISAGFQDGFVRLWDRESRNLCFERQVGGRSIWWLVGGEGKVAIAYNLDENTQIVELWNSNDIDTGLF